MPPDPLAAELAAIRERSEVSSCHHGRLVTAHAISAHDVPRLLAAVGRVLALHQPGRFVVLGAVCEKHEPYASFSITSTEAQHLKDCPDCPATVSVSCTCGYPDLDRCPHRVAITDELLSKDNGHD